MEKQENLVGKIIKILEGEIGKELLLEVSQEVVKRNEIINKEGIDEYIEYNTNKKDEDEIIF